MCPIKMVRTGGLILCAVGILLVTACRSPVDSPDQGVPITPPDKTDLIEKIVEAQALFDSLVVSNDGADVDTDKHWIISTWALKCAIDDAQGIADSPNATAEQIQLALEALTEAYNAANAAKQWGTKGGHGEEPGEKPGEEPVNKSALKAKIAEAETLAASLQTSPDGDNVPPNEKWVTDAEKSKLTDAIQAAKAVDNNEDAAQDAVQSALSALTTAYNEANSAQKWGTTPDKTALNAKIDEAWQKMTEVKTSESGDGSEWKPDEYWVSSAVYTALEEALAVAEQARDYDNATKAAVDAVLANLQIAFDNFDPQPGISVADKDDLNALIRQVEEILARVEVSNNGLDVYDNLEWVTAAEKAALEAVLHEAQHIAGNAVAEQEAVDDITTVLQDAFDAFKPQSGKKAVGHLDFYVTFTQPGDETITLGEDKTPSWILNDTITITVAETFNAYQWYVDGAIKSGATGNSITLYAGDFARNSTHFVTLKVTKGGVPYTKTLTFRVN